tara:strand:+ start:154 stop:390 length:237 start_codon:yes stop_codon:yes gene_type:complete
MPKYPLNLYYLCTITGSNQIIITNKSYRARSSISAAKKAFREDKSLSNITIYDDTNKNILTFDTETFFTYKKEHKMTR